MTQTSSISFVEDLVKTTIPLEEQKHYQINFVSYDRKFLADGQIDEDYKECARKISIHSVEEKYWHDLVYIHKYMTGLDEGGFANVLYRSGHESIYIPIIDFAHNVNIEIVNFTEFFRNLGMPNNKLSIFSSGNSYHGVLDKLMGKDEFLQWLYILKGQKFVDQRWLSISTNNFYGDFSQVLRTTWGRQRPEPKFLKQISIQKKELKEQFV